MMAKLLLRLVHGLKRRAGKLELTAGLKTDSAALWAILAAERDDVALLQHRVPTEAILDAIEQRADAALAVIGDRRMVARIEAELLVLGADAPIALGLRSRLEISDELVARPDDGALRPTHPCRHEENSAWD